ncbi:hypothetical protein D9611_001586 [Ephemerocybe angulata]|uniref:Secreted protein n=1 Tax=Ephemerocybe angulata TaxID=980116 RepID=A0A8H5CKJ1_9AGAR|nr:hypothetical protein D9611_001586 [Tulosesus angulatus]
MFTRLATAVAILGALAGAMAQVTVNTPLSVVVCQPVQFTWTGGQAPYFFSILPGNQPTAPALVDFGKLDGTSQSWTANLAPNTSIFLQVRDSNGALGQSGTITIQNGSDTSCVGKPTSTTSGASSSTTPAGSSTPAATTTPAGSSTTSPAAGSSTSKPATTASTSAGASTTTKPAGNGASTIASSGILALAGVAAVAALL